MNTSRHFLALGASLVAIGLLVIAQTGGIDLLPHIWKLWPAPLIAIGLWILRERGAGRDTSLAPPTVLFVVALLTLGSLLTLRLNDGPVRPDTAVVDALPTLPEIQPPPEVALPSVMVQEIEVPPLSAASVLTIDVRGARVDLTAAPPRSQVQVSLATPGGAEHGERFSVDEETNRVVVRFDAHAPYRAPIGPRNLPLLAIAVPVDARIDLQIIDGELISHGVMVKEMRSAASSLTVEFGNGPLEVDVANGFFQASGVAGEINLTATNTRVQLTGVKGQVKINSSFGDLKLTNLSSTAYIDASFAKVSLNSVAEGVRLNAPDSRIFLKKLQSGATIHTSNGEVRGERIEGTLSIDATRSAILLDEVWANVNIETSHRPIAVTRSRGDVTIRGTDTSIVVKQCKGDLDVEVHGGRLSVRRHRGLIKARGADADLAIDVDRRSPVDLAIDRGNLRLMLGMAGASLDLSTVPGMILIPSDSELESSLEQLDSGMRLVGPIGDGSISVRAKLTHGIMRIEH